MRELGSGTTYNTHNTTSLIRTLKYVSDILKTEEAFTVEEYKHTHTEEVNDLKTTGSMISCDVIEKSNNPLESIVEPCVSKN